MFRTPTEYVQRARRKLKPRTLIVPTIRDAGPGNTIAGQMTSPITGGIGDWHPQQSNTQVLRLPARTHGNYLGSGGTNPYRDMRFRAKEDAYHRRLLGG